ncbi:MAG: alpha/beta hydrolase [Deinococcota bacterium]
MPERSSSSKRPIVLIHGYSSTGNAFNAWQKILLARSYREENIHVVTYQSLTNEVTIRDLAEGFDRALQQQTGLNEDEPFDAIVHSTGMLVIRAWLTNYSKRASRLKHLIGLAPATFGSPLAHKGRGFLVGVFAGNRNRGPDFLEAGDLILGNLELASRFTWDLAHQDLFGDTTFYGKKDDTPYVFIFCGTDKYSGLLRIISQDGTDGTVRLAGCALNSRKIVLDLAGDIREDKRVDTAKWSHEDAPLVPIAGVHHGTIMSDPPPELVEFVMAGLEVDSANNYTRWRQTAKDHSERVYKDTPALEKWQQLIVRVIDERGEPIPDYFIEFIVKMPGTSIWQPFQDVFPKFRTHVHVYKHDPSLRCFHIDLDSARQYQGEPLGIRVIASSGTGLVGYHGYVDPNIAVPKNTSSPREDASSADDYLIDASDLGLPPSLKASHVEGVWDGVIDLSSLNKDVKFFYEFTTTLLEIRLNREPLPLAGVNNLVKFPFSKTNQTLSALDKASAEVHAGDETRTDELFKQLLSDSERD